jgi:hypothetical protein
MQGKVLYVSVVSFSVLFISYAKVIYAYNELNMLPVMYAI